MVLISWILRRKKDLHDCWISSKMFHHKESSSLEQTNPAFTCSVNSLVIKENCDASTNSNICKAKQPEKHNPFLGFFCISLTSVFMTLTSVFVKKLTYISPGHLSMVRNIGVLAGCLPIAIYSSKEVIGPKKDRLLLIIRGFLGATALYLNLTAFRYLPLAEAAILMSIVPTLTTIVAYFYLKEPCGRVHILSLLISLCGVVSSMRLPVLLSKRSTTRFDSAYMGGLASAVGCVITITFTLVTLRKMRDLHFSVPLLYFGFIGMTENAVISFTTSVFVYPVCGWDPILVMLIGIFGFVGHCTMTLAIQAEAVGIITVMKASIDIVVAMILQILFFDNDIDMYNILGAILVIVSVSMIGFNKWLHMLPEESKAKEKFKFLL